MHLKKILLIIFVVLTNLMNTNAALPAQYYEVVLNTGEVYVGEIILKNAEIVILKTEQGERFQFPVASIKSITPLSEKPDEKITDQPKGKNDEEYSMNDENQNFCGMLEFSGGLSVASKAFKKSPTGEGTLSFGSRSIAGKSLFVGLGAGCTFLLLQPDSKLNVFAPVFIRLQSNNLTKSRTSPYFSLDTGYSFALKSLFSGGIYGKLSAGVIRKISYKSYFSFGIFTRVQQFSGTLTETINNKVYSYNGNSAFFNYGLSAGIQF